MSWENMLQVVQQIMSSQRKKKEKPHDTGIAILTWINHPTADIFECIGIACQKTSGQSLIDT